MQRKEIQVFQDLVRLYSNWMAWYVPIFLLAYLFLRFVIPAEHVGENGWSILQSGTISTLIYFVVLGVLSISHLIKFYLPNGVTRSDYYKGTCLTLIPMGTILTLIMAGLYYLEHWIVTLLDLQGFGPSPDPTLLIGLWFQTIIHYLIGWVIGTAFHRFHWLIGILVVALSAPIFALLDGIWGVERGWFHWLMPDFFYSLGSSIGGSLLIIALLAFIVRRMTRSISVNA